MCSESDGYIYSSEDIVRDLRAVDCTNLITDEAVEHLCELLQEHQPYSMSNVVDCLTHRENQEARKLMDIQSLYL